MAKYKLFAGVVPTAFLIVAIACGSGDPDFESIATNRGATDPAEFAEAATHGRETDFGPYRSPQEAVEKVDAIVVGHARVVAVASRPERDFGYVPRYVVFEVSVDETLFGERHNSVYALLRIAPIANVEAIAKATPTTHTLWMLVDASGWPPYLEMSGVPEGPVFYYQPDGMWVETVEGGLAGVGYPRDALEQDWGPVESFDDMVQILRDAASSRD